VNPAPGAKRAPPAEIDPARWHRLKDHLADLAELAPTARAAALQALVLAPDDRRWLQDLAAQLDADGAPLPLPGWSPGAGVSLLRWQAGERVGNYVIDGFLGRGGMGEVYAARHVDSGAPVALKILRPGLQQDGLGHFSQNEQRALKRLDDPRIARFMDAFTLPDLGLCLVLEQIAGEPVDQWCVARQLPSHRRLQLFVQICEAVASAHLHLVVHRDLKPGNVLITADGDVKLLDFGVAKLLDEDATDTRTHGGLYTLEYAAPEQVLRQPVSVATDIYALGVLLYRLLTQASPYATAPDESLIKAVLSDHPRPLAAASGSAGRSAAAFDRDLDRVIARAMEKDPRDRYRSAMELAVDVQAIIDGEPIRASGGRYYRLSKFVRRHPGGVATTLLLLLAMLLATGVSLYWARLANASAQAAAAESQRATAVSNFLIGLFQDADPGVNRGDQLTANQILTRGSARLQTQLADQPLQRARLQVVTGEVYVAMGEYARARVELQAGIDTLRAHGDAVAELAHALRMLAYVASRESALTEALELISQAQSLLDASALAAPTERAQLALLSCRARSDLGQLPEAAIALDGAGQHARTIVPRNLEIDASIHAAAGDLADESGDFNLARTEYQAALADFRQALGEDHYRTVAVQTNLGALLVTKFEDLDAAQPLLENALLQWQTLRGNRSAAYASTANTLGELFRHRGQHARAAELFADSELAYRAALGDQHPSITWPITNHGKSLADQGQYLQALDEYQRALDIVVQSLPESRMRATQIHRQLVTVLIPLQRYQQALSLAEQALLVYRADLPPDHPDVVNTLYLIGFAHYGLGDQAAARVAWDEALQRGRRAFAHLPSAFAKLQSEIADPDAVLREYATRAVSH
jgi:eukaryotic-like serine/threonine-protein kinase